MPWIRIPAATITFQGEAEVHDFDGIPQEIQQALLKGIEFEPEAVSDLCIIRVRPTGRFLTYGVGVSLQQMRNPELARGQAPV